MEPSSSGPGRPPAAAAAAAAVGRGGASEEQLRVKRKTLQAVLDQCHRALEMLNDEDLDLESAASDGESRASGEMYQEPREGSYPSSSCFAADFEADELCEFLKSKVESPDFLEKLGSNETSVSIRKSDEIASWDLVNIADFNAENGSDEDDYVLVKQEDIVDGIASFMAAYLLSLEETKDLSPKRLQEALCKTFAVNKKKGKLRKAWDGSKVVYNVASLGATAIGICQNPALIGAASTAFWTSCRVISKFL